ncbi:MAG: hypothetical protein AB1467_05065 [Candidatus Diapherotrites archaeon]
MKKIALIALVLIFFAVNVWGKLYTPAEFNQRLDNIMMINSMNSTSGTEPTPTQIIEGQANSQSLQEIKTRTSSDYLEYYNYYSSGSFSKDQAKIKLSFVLSDLDGMQKLLSAGIDLSGLKSALMQQYYIEIYNFERGTSIANTTTGSGENNVVPMKVIGEVSPEEQDIIKEYQKTAPIITEEQIQPMTSSIIWVLIIIAAIALIILISFVLKIIK